MVSIPDSQGKGPGVPRVEQLAERPVRFEVAAPADPALPQMAADALDGVGDALATLMAVLKGESAETVDGAKLAQALKDLDPVFPAMTQTIVELLMRSSTLVQTLLGLADPAPAGPPQTMFVVAKRPEPEPDTYEPLPPLGNLTPPIAPLLFTRDKLAGMDIPPLPPLWLGWLRGASEDRWTLEEGERYAHEMPTTYHLHDLQEAVENIPDLAAFFGGRLQLHPRALAASAPDLLYIQDLFTLARRLGPRGLPGVTGAYLIALYQLYRDYKAEYYGVFGAWRRLLDRQDPAHPLHFSEIDLNRYLEQKYGPRMRGLLRRMVRAPLLSHDYLPPTPLEVDQLYDSVSDPEARKIEDTGFQSRKQGNFVAVKSESGDLEVQIAVGPHPNGKGGMANLGVAVKAGSDVLIYDATTKRLWVNGVPSAWGDGLYALPGGGRVRFTPEGMLITSPRNDGVNVLDRGGYLDLFGRVAAGRLAGSVSGLLGFFDGDQEDERVSREGLVMAPTDRDRFVESWRVRAGESLFDLKQPGPWQPR